MVEGERERFWSSVLLQSGLWIRFITSHFGVVFNLLVWGDIGGVFVCIL